MDFDPSGFNWDDLPTDTGDGKRLIECPAKGGVACGLYPVPEPTTQDPVLICTGPILSKTGSQIEEVRGECKYRPQRLENDSDTR